MAEESGKDELALAVDLTTIKNQAAQEQSAEEKNTTKCIVLDTETWTPVDSHLPEKTSSDVPDGGWGWVVVLACFVIHFFFTGVNSTWGLFYADVQAKFNVSLTAVSWLGSIYNGFGCVAGLLMPLIIQRIGCRKSGFIGVTLLCGGYFCSMFVNNIYLLYFTASVLPGIGHGMQYIASMTVVSKYFDRKRPLAFGGSVCGGAVGAIVLPLLVTSLLTTFTLWGTFWLLGAVMLNEYCCDLTFRPTENKVPAQSSTNGSKVQVRDYLILLRTPRMVLLLLCGLTQALVYFIFHSFIPTISRRQIEGLTVEQASFILSVSGIASIFGRVLSGVVSTILHRYTLQFYIITLWGCGVSNALVTISATYPLMLIAGAMYGMFHGGIWALQPTVVHQLFDIRMFSHAYGLLYVVMDLASLVGVPFASYLADITGNDMALFYMATTGFLMSGLTLVPLTFTRDLVCGHRKDQDKCINVTIVAEQSR